VATSKIGDNEIAIIDVFVGIVTGAVAFYLGFVVNDPVSIQAAAFTLLFTFTYFWVAWNRWNHADGRGLGWFCLLSPSPPCLSSSKPWAQPPRHGMYGSQSAGCRGALWFLFFLILALGRSQLPGYLLLTGRMPGVETAAPPVDETVTGSLMPLALEPTQLAAIGRQLMAAFG
jgi:hypothetical protein